MTRAKTRGASRADYRDMQVLIFGAKGMLGGYLQTEFSDYDVTALDKSDVDIVDAQAVLTEVLKIGPDVIINAAAYTDVDGAESERDVAMAVNENGSRNVANAAAEVGATMIQFSTDYVFPGTREDGYAVADTPGPPVNAYGESKLAGEIAVRDKLTSFYIIRTAWLYGKGGNNFVNTMLSLAKKDDDISVVDDQHGSPTYAKDLAKATRKLIDDDYDHGIYHLTGEGVTTWHGFAEEVFKQVGQNIEIKKMSSDQVSRAAKRPEYGVLKNGDGPTMRPWKDALFEYVSEIV